MAILPSATLDEISSEYKSDVSELHEEHPGVTSDDIRAAIAAVDQWVEDNKASYNTALPTAAQTNLTATQKSRLLTYVIARRFQEGE